VLIFPRASFRRLPAQVNEFKKLVGSKLSAAVYDRRKRGEAKTFYAN
jgi:hypothetical protein